MFTKDNPTTIIDSILNHAVSRILFCREEFTKPESRDMYDFLMTPEVS